MIRLLVDVAGSGEYYPKDSILEVEEGEAMRLMAAGLAIPEPATTAIETATNKRAEASENRVQKKSKGR